MHDDENAGPGQVQHADDIGQRRGVGVGVELIRLLVAESRFNRQRSPGKPLFSAGPRTALSRFRW